MQAECRCSADDFGAGEIVPASHGAIPSPSGRGSGRGLPVSQRLLPVGLLREPSPCPPELLSKGPEGEGIAPSEAGTISPAPESSTKHLHSACIAQAKEAETAAFQAAQRKLAQWSHVLAQQPGFSAEAYLKAEVAATLQRKAALMRSSAALPGHNSRSPSALNGVGTVLR